MTLGPVLRAMLVSALCVPTVAAAQGTSIDVEELAPPAAPGAPTDERVVRSPPSRDDARRTRPDGPAFISPPARQSGPAGGTLAPPETELEVRPLPEEAGEPSPLLPDGVRIGRGAPAGDAGDAAGGDETGPAVDGDGLLSDRFRRAPPGTSARERRRAIEIGATEARSGARLRMLDMITGGTETLDVATGEEAVLHGRLRLRLIACEAPLDGSQVGNIALLQIWDDAAEDGEALRFSGWMFADSPALSALDHSRYDVWLISCTTRSGEASASNE